MAIIKINLLGVKVEINDGIAICPDKRVEHVINMMLEQIPPRPQYGNFDEYAAGKVADWLGGEVMSQRIFRD